MTKFEVQMWVCFLLHQIKHCNHTHTRTHKELFAIQLATIKQNHVCLKNLIILQFTHRSLQLGFTKGIWIVSDVTNYLTGDTVPTKNTVTPRLCSVKCGEKKRTKCEGGGGRAEEKQRHSFDLQMRLTRRLPSASLPPRQAKISGLTLEAQWKSCVRQEIRRKIEKGWEQRSKAADLQCDNETGFVQHQLGLFWFSKIKMVRAWMRLAKA